MLLGLCTGQVSGPKPRGLPDWRETSSATTLHECKSALAGEPSGFCLLVCLFTGALYILEYPVLLFVDKKLRLLEIKKTCSRSPRESTWSCLAVEFKVITDPSRLFPLRTERAFAQDCSQDVSEPLKTL